MYMFGAFDVEQCEYAHQRLARLGVELRNNTRVVDVEADRLHLNDDSTLEAAAIVWAAGVEAHPLTRQLGVPLADRAGRIAPNADLSLPGHPEVFLAGDLVSLKNDDGTPVPGVAPAAMQMGRHVAGVLKEELRLETTRFADQKHDLRPRFRYVDKGIMAIIGKNAAVAKSGRLRLRGFPAWVAWLFVHLLFLIGFRNKLSVLLGWAFAYLKDTPDARIIVRPGGDRPAADISRAP